MLQKWQKPAGRPPSPERSSKSPGEVQASGRRLATRSSCYTRACPVPRPPEWGWGAGSPCAPRVPRPAPLACLEELDTVKPSPMSVCATIQPKSRDGRCEVTVSQL